MILLKNITLNEKQVDILIDGKRISRISPAAPSSPEPGTEVVDCSGKTALPALVNMHTHAAMSLLRGVREDVDFHDWISEIWRLEAKLDEDFVYHGTKVACLEMAKSGTVTFNDQYWFPLAALRATGEIGLRPAISYVILDLYDKEKAAIQRDECAELYEKSRSWNPEDAVFTVSIHSAYTVSEEMILFGTEFARKHHLPIHIHLAETEKEQADSIKERGITTVKYLDELGVLGPDVIAGHSLWLTDEDVEILGRNRVSCVYNVNSNLKLASGYRFRYNDLKAAGVNVCIGTDGAASSNNLDLLETMKTSAIVQKAINRDPRTMPIQELLDAATVNGARALGIDTGEIREGKLADILIIDTDSPAFLSPAPFLSNLIYSAHSDCIESVIAGGKFVVRNRRIEGEKEMLQQARDILRELD